MTQQALTGIRVLDFTRVLAGPLCTMMLADLGADVIKVENPGMGDETRQWGPPWFTSGDYHASAYFLSVNRNKRSLALNLKSASGQALARQLARHSHVLMENFKPGQMAAFGLSHEQLRADNPALVYCSLTGYGQTGQYSERPGYDYVVQAMSGFMSITGEKDGEPVKAGVAISDVIAGLHAAVGILAALRHAEHTGEGQQVDIALLDTQLAALVNVASSYLVSGSVPGRYGNQHANIVPYQTFYASDGAFVVAVGNDRQFAQLCQLLHHPEWAQDERFMVNPARVHNRDRLAALLQAQFSTRPVAAWVAELLAMGIPAGPINSVAQALDDPHIQARGMIQSFDMGAESLRFVASPLHLSATPPVAWTPPPRIGEHSDAILRDWLGYDDATIEQYRAEGVIG